MRNFLRLLLPFAIVAFHLSTAHAQQTIADAEWFQRTIALGVVWKHYQFDTLFGSKQSISVIEADLSNPNVVVRLPYLTNTRAKTSVFTPQQYPAAAAAVNGTFFDTSPGSGGCTTYLRANGTLITPEQQGGMAVDGGMCQTAPNVVTGDQTVTVEPRPVSGWDSKPTGPLGVSDILVQGPLILLNNATASFTNYTSHCAPRHPRTMVGVTNTNKLILVTADGRTDGAAGLTCDEMATVMRDLGCDDATSLDGGGSTTMWVRGEENGGVVNYPSDNGVYDHLGERSCSNAIAIISPAAPPAALDARILSAKYFPAVIGGTSQTVTLSYRNIGTQTWTAANTKLKVTRPRTRTSPFAADSAWPATDTPALLPSATVAPDAVTTFSFVMTAPVVPAPTIYYEHFGLYEEGVGPFGPADNEPRLKITVSPQSVPTTGVIVIESRLGGKNYQWYAENGVWADSATNCTTPDATGNIGMRWGSTYRSVAGAKSATYTPDFAEQTTCGVFVTWGNGGSRRNPVTYEVIDANGTTKYLVDQTGTPNVWQRLGAHTFYAGTSGYVRVSNSDIDASGSMYSAAVRFDPENVPVSVSTFSME
ncbi:MAG: phosphodiester glycosidase family protein [Candidatus Sumerlaeaceae bacterium]